MLEIDKNKIVLKKAGLETSDQPLACPVDREELYKKLRANIAAKVEHELEVEEYYLSEHDYAWYNGDDSKKRLQKIDELRKRTPEQKERETHARIMAEIFKTNPQNFPQQGEIFNAQKDSTRKEAA